MKPRQVTPGAYWVGAIDWDLRDFHGLATPSGGSYNAYLLDDEKKVIIDAVYPELYGEFIARVEQVVDPADVDYVISSHAEFDHSGGLPELMRRARKATLITTEKGKAALESYFDTGEWKIQTIKNGDKLNIGKRTLTFLETPMLHWPETMFTYSDLDKILFTCDAFGAQIAPSELFADQVEDVLHFSKDYFTFIFRVYGRAVLNAIAKIKSLDYQIIAPSHGPVWRENVDRLVATWANWADNPETEKVSVIFYSMWGGTKRMAHAVAEGVSQEGVEVKVLDLAKTATSEIMADVLDSRAVIMGSPTFVANVHPVVLGFLPMLEMLRPKGKIGAVFGTYGWAGGGVTSLTTRLNEMGLLVVAPQPNVKLGPKADDLNACVELGALVARQVKSAR